MKLSIKSISVLTVAFLSLASRNSWADVETDYSLVVNKSFLATELLNSERSLEVNKSLPPSVWQMALPIKVQAGQVNLKSNLTNINFNNDGDTVTSTLSGLSFSIRLDQFAIDTVVPQNVGGTVISIRVQTTCQGLGLSYDDSEANLGATFQLGSSGGRLSLTTLALNLNLAPEKWRLSSFHCDNIQGIEQTISNQIQKSFFSDPANLQKILSSYLDSEGANYLTQLMTSTLQTLSNLSGEYHVKIAQKVVSMNTSGDLLTTHIHAKLNSKNTGSFKLTDDSFQNVTTMAVFLPKDFMELLIQESILQQLSAKKMSSRDIPGMQSLMQSRILQFFFWPALMQLPSRAVLNLQAYLQNSKLSLKDVNGLTVGIDLTGDFGVWVSHDMPMVYLSSPINISGTVSSEGLSTIKMKPLNIKKHWYEKYLDRYNPPTTINTGYFTSDLQSYIKKQIQTFAWPKFSGPMNLNFSQAKLVGSTLGIYYQ